MNARHRVEGERGETLLELLVSITILGVCVVAIASGIAVSVRISAIHRSQATASDWLHIHVVPEGNLRLRRRGGAPPELVGATMSEIWRSVLREPERYRVMTPTELLAGVDAGGRWASWRKWLGERYLT